MSKRKREQKGIATKSEEKKSPAESQNSQSIFQSLKHLLPAEAIADQSIIGMIELLSSDLEENVSQCFNSADGTLTLKSAEDEDHVPKDENDDIIPSAADEIADLIRFCDTRDGDKGDKKAYRNFVSAAIGMALDQVLSKPGSQLLKKIVVMENWFAAYLPASIAIRDSLQEVVIKSNGYLKEVETSATDLVDCDGVSVVLVNAKRASLARFSNLSGDPVATINIPNAAKIYFYKCGLFLLNAPQATEASYSECSSSLPLDLPNLRKLDCEKSHLGPVRVPKLKELYLSYTELESLTIPATCSKVSSDNRSFNYKEKAERLSKEKSLAMVELLHHNSMGFDKRNPTSPSSSLMKLNNVEESAEELSVLLLECFDHESETLCLWSRRDENLNIIPNASDKLAAFWKKCAETNKWDFAGKVTAKALAKIAEKNVAVKKMVVRSSFNSPAIPESLTCLRDLEEVEIYDNPHLKGLKTSAKKRIECFGVSSIETINALDAKEINLNNCSQLNLLDAPKALVAACSNLSNVSIKVPSVLAIGITNCRSFSLDAQKTENAFFDACTSFSLNIPMAVDVTYRKCSSTSPFDLPSAQLIKLYESNLESINAPRLVNLGSNKSSLKSAILPKIFEETIGKSNIEISNIKFLTEEKEKKFSSQPATSFQSQTFEKVENISNSATR